MTEDKHGQTTEENSTDACVLVKCYPVTLEHIPIGQRDGSSRKDEFLYARKTTQKSYLKKDFQY